MTKRTCITTDCQEDAAGAGKYCHSHSPRRAWEVPLEDRMMARVEIGNEDECWPWMGHIDRRGYGQFRSHSLGNISAHRFVYTHLVGPIPDGMHIDHACHNTRCVNPSHLRPLSPKQNVENFTTPTRANNTTGYRGVWVHSSGLFAASVTHNYKRYDAGYHRTAEAAGEAARKLRLELHGYNDMDRAGGCST